MTILHLKGLSPGGLGAALLACGGLTKVKLQTSFKSLLPQPLLQHLESRGCVFQWREKPFQVSFSYLFLPTFSLKNMCGTSMVVKIYCCVNQLELHILAKHNMVITLSRGSMQFQWLSCLAFN